MKGTPHNSSPNQVHRMGTW